MISLRTKSLRSIRPGTRVLMRVDLNIPTGASRSSESDYRIEMVIPDIQALRKRKAKTILMTHFGRPKGRDKSLSTTFLAKLLRHKYDLPVRHTTAVSGVLAKRAVDRLAPGEILLLENLRFDPREKENSADFANELAQLADVYVNNAFAVSHRKHASVHAITKQLPSFAGPLVTHEVKELNRKLPKPSALLLGGIKLEDKVKLIEHLAGEVGVILTGGGIAVTFLSAITGKSFYAVNRRITLEQQRIADRLLAKYPDLIHVPIDARVAQTVGANVFAVRSTEELRVKDRIFDIGPDTEKEFCAVLEKTKGIIWNGPFGYIERVGARKGTRAIAKCVAEKGRTRTVVGGGDTLRFLTEERYQKAFSFVSTGGGAMLVYLAGEKMPGLEVLKR